MNTSAFAAAGRGGRGIYIPHVPPEARAAFHFARAFFARVLQKRNHAFAVAPENEKSGPEPHEKKCSSDPLMRMRGMREAETIDGLIVTGPTGTNVNDIAIALLDTEEE